MKHPKGISCFDFMSPVFLLHVESAALVILLAKFVVPPLPNCSIILRLALNNGIYALSRHTFITYLEMQHRYSLLIIQRFPDQNHWPLTSQNIKLIIFVHFIFEMLLSGIRRTLWSRE